MHLALSSNNLLPSEQLTTFHFPRVYVWLVLSNGSANNTYICIHLYLYIRVDFKGGTPKDIYKSLKIIHVIICMDIAK